MINANSANSKIVEIALQIVHGSTLTWVGRGLSMSKQGLQSANLLDDHVCAILNRRIAVNHFKNLHFRPYRKRFLKADHIHM